MSGLYKDQAGGKTREASLGPFEIAVAPTDGAAGTLAGIAVKGSLLINTVTGYLYQNTNTKASPTWTRVFSGSLDAGSIGNVANANATGGIPEIFRIDVADASGDTDVVMAHKVRVLDAWGLNTGIAAHATTDTWQVKNGANAITDAVAKTATVNAVKRISTIDPARHEIAAGGTLRITAAKTTNAAVTVYVLAIRVA